MKRQLEGILWGVVLLVAGGVLHPPPGNAQDAAVGAPPAGAAASSEPPAEPAAAPAGPTASVSGPTAGPSGREAAREAAGLWLSAHPLIEVASGSQVSFLSLGTGAALTVEYRFPSLPYLGIAAAGAYRYVPVTATASLNLLGVGGQVLGYLQMAPKLVGSLAAGVGYCHGGLSGAPSSGSRDSFYLAAALALRWLFAPGLGAYLGFEYDENWSLYRSGGLHMGVSYAPGRTVPRTKVQTAPAAPSAPASRPVPQAREDDGGEALLELSEVRLESVYPVLLKSYARRPVGSAVLRNPQRKAVRNVIMSVYVEGYMDQPRLTLVAEELGPRQAVEVGLYAWFDPRILSRRDSGEVQARIGITCELDGVQREQAQSWTLPIESRNAVPPADVRAAAAFVTADDPLVVELAGRVVDWIDGRRYEMAGASLQRAIALYEALSVSGIRVDPAAGSGYPGRLQFPRDTLESGVGSRGDLAVLYGALLEAAGVETALFAFGGQIVPAFALSQDPSSAAAVHFAGERAVRWEGRAWVLVDTSAAGGFLQASQAGADSWGRQASAAAPAPVLPREAWQTYAPASMAGHASSGDLPTRAEVTGAYDREIQKIMSEAVSPLIAELSSDRASEDDERSLSNGIGVLLARYGLYEQAEERFEEAQAGGEYAPAQVNLGHLAFLRGETQTALRYYERALSLEPEDQLVVLALARAHYELGDYETARLFYQTLREMNALLAGSFYYLERAADAGGRPRAWEKARSLVLWAEG